MKAKAEGSFSYFIKQKQPKNKCWIPLRLDQLMTAKNLCGGKPRESVPNIVAIHPSDVRNSGAKITTSCWLLKVKPLVIGTSRLES